MRLAALGRNHDDGHAFCIYDAWKLFYKLQPVHDRHVDVTKNQIDRVFLENCKRLGPISGF